jgi:type IV pilus assembly protein PilN
MPRINLLPWRETLKQEREQRFLIIMGAALGTTAMVFASVHFFIAGLISGQQSRNDYLTSEIKQAEALIEEIKTLDEKKAQLINRMEAIVQLQEQRSLVVHLFDELVRKTSEGVYFTNLAQKGTQIILKGVAESDARVSSLMSEFKSSQWLTSPKIYLIERKGETSPDKKNKKERSISVFELEIAQVVPKGAEPKATEATKPDGKTAPPPKQ